jgi:TetR/AcrR family transcriptional regulator
MNSYSLDFSNYAGMMEIILGLEKEGRVTRTFRRLDPERQAAVIGAIFADAVESGPQSLNIKRVAERAGVSVGSLYQYFGSRQGLLDFAIELAVRVTQAEFDQYRDMLAQMPLPDALSAYGSGGMEWAGQAAGFTRFYARAAYGGDAELAGRVVKPIAETMLGMVRGMLSAAQSRGEVRQDIDLEATARVLHALTIALYDPLLLPYLNDYFQITGDNAAPERTIQAAMEMVLRGIGRGG